VDDPLSFNDSGTGETPVSRRSGLPSCPFVDKSHS
jgi:hypothetical protein